MCGDIRDTFTR